MPQQKFCNLENLPRVYRTSSSLPFALLDLLAWFDTVKGSQVYCITRVTNGGLAHP